MKLVMLELNISSCFSKEEGELNVSSLSFVVINSLFPLQ
jgi:hypothetical protein